MFNLVSATNLQHEPTAKNANHAQSPASSAFESCESVAKSCESPAHPESFRTFSQLIRKPDPPIITDDAHDSHDSQRGENKTETFSGGEAGQDDLPTHYEGGTNGKVYGDTKWIRQQLKRLPPLMRKQAIETYSTLYQKAYNAEPKEHTKESAGRFVANNWLRLQVEGVLKPRRHS